MRRQVWSLMMNDVSEYGTTVLVSSHNLRELEDVCDHVGILDHGRVLLERSLAQLQDNMVKLQVRHGAEGQPEGGLLLHALAEAAEGALLVDLEDLLAFFIPLHGRKHDDSSYQHRQAL